jgi:2-amino-4-hydroxy-6-hydroxymethyldihydropteridine diphosphokinase
VAEQPVDVFVAVGSNIEPHVHVPRALRLLKTHVKVTGSSTFYWTSPVGRPGQPRFLNGVWRVETTIPARALKYDVLRGIETHLGRVRTADKDAPRPIDLDIVLYGQLVVDECDLTIPDPQVRRRPFVAVPIVELAPGVVLPDTGEMLVSLAVAREAANLEAAHEISGQLQIILKA